MRWQPTRLGLVDLFLYDHAEFRFRDGHLLLRGNNGTGKSKVLALTLPFLLDGDVSAARVEPDGDPTKRMDWNLLLGDRYPERLGYTWLEFGRRDESGASLFLTVGCGLRAVSGRGLVDRWFFVTTGRIGADFNLVGPSGVAHSRERLGEVLEGIGHVYRRAEDYRRAIDERLFRLGQERYDALVSLLIQLRQPQLSRRPDEDKLSRALSESLRPVDQAILNTVAEAFHDLEQQREELRGLRETHSDVDRFLNAYRSYAAVAARRLARDVRSSHSAFQSGQRELAEVRQELEWAEAEDRAAATARRTVADELASARGRAAELRESREVRELDAAERLMHMAEQQAQQSELLREEAVRDHERQAAALEALRRAAQEAARQLEPVLASVNRCAQQAGLPPAAVELFAKLVAESESPVEEAIIQSAETVATKSSRARTEAVRHVRTLIERASAAAEKLTAARTRLHELIAEHDAARDLQASTLADVNTTAAALVESWRKYLESLLEIALPSGDRLLERIAAWSSTLDGADPGATAIANAADVARNTLSELRAAALIDHEAKTVALEALIDERERLRRGETLRPAAHYTRDIGIRESRQGAPLWELVDFHPDLAESHRAGLEASLESAGILDAWVTPDGQLLAPNTHDVIVLGGPPVSSATSLAAVLQPAIDRNQPRAAAVSEEKVRRILAGIGLGADSADCWVDTSGDWHVGVLQGFWSKPRATFIGRGARDAARHHRIAELAVEIERAEHALDSALQDLRRIETRQRSVSAELSRMPNAEPLRESHRAASEARRVLTQAAARVSQQEAAVAELDSAAQVALAARDEAALDLQLPADLPTLERVNQAIAEYDVATAGLWPRARNQLERLDAIRSNQLQLQLTQAILVERTGRAEAERRAALEERGRWEGLRASIGATVEQIQRELEAISARIRSLEEEDQRLEEARRQCAHRIGRAQDSQVRLERSLSEQNERRSQAIGTLQKFATDGLLVLAVPGVELPSGGWAPDPVARLARRVEQSLEATEADDQAWERVRREISTHVKELQDGMTAHGHSAVLEATDGWFLVRITFHGQQHSPDELAQHLCDDIDHREHLLNARERELLEEHLVNEIASHLQELIHEADVQVHDMNDELRQRPTSTGMRLRLRWSPRSDGPVGLAEARARLMRQVHDAWSVEDRSAVSAFLKAQIDAVRTANESGTWLEHLTEAFDYRRWHRFSIERMQDGNWRSASGPASSGERVLTVTLPLFAAASAHYRSAHAMAPRLVLMDEVFAGVDDDSRAKSIGLLDTFDLDFVMTSEREWGCYATLPGLAIYQLARREGIDAVHVTAWTWDGQVRSRVLDNHASPNSEVHLNGSNTNGHIHD